MKEKGPGPKQPLSEFTELLARLGYTVEDLSDDDRASLARGVVPHHFMEVLRQVREGEEISEQETKALFDEKMPTFKPMPGDFAEKLRRSVLDEVAKTRNPHGWTVHEGGKTEQTDEPKDDQT